MRNYITNSGEQFFAEDSKQLVRLLREESRIPTETEKEFMEDVAKRVYAMFGRPLATDTPEAFVSGLIDCGLVDKRPVTEEDAARFEKRPTEEG